MIERIELLDEMIYKDTQHNLMDGLACIQMILDCVHTGNIDLINLLENGR